MGDSEKVGPGPILVTGALGTIGRRVVSGLVDRDRLVRAADVDPAALVAALGAEVQSVRFDFTDPDSWAAR